MQFNNVLVSSLESRLTKLLKEQGEKYGLGGLILRSDGFTEVDNTANKAVFRVTATVKEADSSPTLLEMFAQQDNINVRGIGAKGEVLVDYHPNKPKYPYIYRTKAGTMYKATPEQARVKFGALT